MYIKNTTSKEIGPVSAMAGYEFVLPANRVMVIHDEAGKFLVELYKPKGEGSTALPPVMMATKKEWDNKSYAIVSRFQIKQGLIRSREDLLRLGRERGLDKELIEKYERDASIDSDEIVLALNSMPVPEDIRFPETGKTEE